MLRGNFAFARVAAAAAVGAAIGGGCFSDIPELTASGGEVGSSTTGSSTSTSSTGATAGSSTAESSSSGATTGSAPSSCADLETLFACYEFETFDGTLYDSTPTGLFGVQQAVEAVEGRHGKGARFSAASAVFVGNDPDKFQAMLNAFTIGAWIRPAAGNVGAPRGILDKDGFFTITVLDVEDGSFLVQCMIGGATVAAMVKAAVDSWIHVACSYETGVGVTAVINGEVGGMSAATALVGDDSMFIGNDGPMTSAATAFLGVIDDVQLWSTALTLAEICQAADLAC